MKALIIFDLNALKINDINILADNFIKEKLTENSVIRLNSGYVDRALTKYTLSEAFKLILKMEWHRKEGVSLMSPANVNITYAPKGQVELDLSTYQIMLHDNGLGDRIVFCTYKNPTLQYGKNIMAAFDGDEKVLHSYLMTLSIPYNITQY